MARIGLYGGSFNPVHLGHLRSALEVRAAADLEAVWLIPAHQPPHKNAREVAPAADRLAMLELATARVPELRPEPIELERDGPSYTIDTLTILRSRHPGVEFTLILGFDAFREIHTWHRHDALLSQCDLIVTTRPPYVVPSGPKDQLFEELPIAVQQRFWYDASIGIYVHESGRRLEFLPVTALEISASALREAVSRGVSIRFLVPDVVHDYVLERGLYRGSI